MASRSPLLLEHHPQLVVHRGGVLELVHQHFERELPHDRGGADDVHAGGRAFDAPVLFGGIGGHGVS